MKANYPIYRPLTKRKFRVSDHYIYPHEFAVLDPDSYFLRFSE
ncbi:galactose-1-phosphate uridylyltransferase [Streptococcus pneumoniae]|nr:galactose-1-phosphate uridylyltransferase [Streptococcus pneumoniae]